MSFGERLKEARINKGFTQKQLSLSLNITNTAISNYEKDISFPNTDILYKIFDILGCDPNFLFQDVVDIKASPILTTEEEKLINDYRDLSQQGQEYIQQTMFLAKQTYKKSTDSAMLETQTGA